ncbi:MAG: O-methyltransferase [Acidobacteriota bacterium]|nr:O-methyltransferase [Acidobacteriota bacterium]
MKLGFDRILQTEQAVYLEKLLPASTDILAEMEQLAAKQNIPISDKETALFLEITASAIKAKKCLEIGMAIGYGAFFLLRGMPENGIVTTIEPSDERINQAEDFLTRAGLRERIEIKRGTALEILPELSPETYDLIYLDAVKEEYSEYLEKSLPLLKTGGVILADNVLWGGQVAGDVREERYENSTRALREFNELFVNHPQLRGQILPIGDGLAYGVKIK